MNLPEAIQQTITVVASSLLWPTCALLILSVLHVAYLVGGVTIEAWQRRGAPRSLGDPERPPEPMARRRGIATYVRLRAADPAASPWLVVDRVEAELSARIDRSRLWVRLGPALGLAATLIPLGPALTALARNDLRSLSEALILAFGSTVLGLLSGGTSWVVATTIERWYRSDLSELRHALEARETAVTS